MLGTEDLKMDQTGSTCSGNSRLELRQVKMTTVEGNSVIYKRQGVKVLWQHRGEDAQAVLRMNRNLSGRQVGKVPPE